VAILSMLVFQDAVPSVRGRWIVGKDIWTGSKAEIFVKIDRSIKMA